LVYGASQNLLFSRVNMGLVPAVSLGFLLCSVLIAFSVIRYRLLNVNMYMSRFVVYNSLTLLVVGGYLILIGLVSQVIQSFNFLPGYPLEILFLLTAILLFFSVFVSDRLRWKVRMLINKHFYRSRYDYREEWLKFAEGLSSKLGADELVATTVNMLRDLVGLDEVSVWLSERDDGYLTPMGRSSGVGSARLKIAQKFTDTATQKKVPFSIDTPWAREFAHENKEILERLEPALFVPLVSGKEMVGLILLGKKTTGEKFLGDDIDILKSASAEISSAIVKAKLSQELISAKEMEVFHRFSSFVLHDLKNLVANLSLVMGNANEHMGDPDFQKDAMDTIGKSVKKMEALITKLSNNVGDQRLSFQKANLNDSVSRVVRRMEQNGRKGKASVQIELGNIPPVLADREQIEKVIVNLLLNAFEAFEDGGLISVKTEANGGKVILSVSDNGPGISSEFMENELFKPFKSTKKKGLGIGLYQCKSIVEGHSGSITVESKEGTGSTFRVILPVSM
jgi:putative PEP-CTERM system histidine kinase